MKPRIAFVTLVILAGLATAALYPTARAQPASAVADDATWFTVDPIHSSIIFGVNHLGVSTFYGRINNPAGEFHVSLGDPGASSFSISAKTQNVDTNNDGRNQHLKSGDFFDAKQFADITFKSTSVARTGKATFAVTGDLTLHGVTKPINIMIEHIGTKETRMGVRSGFTANFTIKRSDFGMNYMVGAIGDEVTLMIGIEGVKK
jgi:polyisoprenoid-binding protein YceI